MAEKIQEYKKNKAEIPVTLEDTLSRFFCRNLESLESQGGIWKIKAEKQPGRYCLSHNERNECMIVRENSVITVIPYQELSSIPNMAVSALRKVMSDCNVTLSEYERVFETPLDKAKYLIDTFCESEYGSGADLSDLSKIPIAYTTLTDDELPINVYADLKNYTITRMLNGEEIESEKYKSLESMIEHELEQLDFNELISVPDEIIEKTYYNCKESSSGVTVTGYIGSADVLYIPSSIKGRKVTEISENAFADNTFIKEAYIPDTVTAIGAGAFYYCDSLEKVSIPSSVKNIGADAFYGCRQLTEVNLPAGCKYDKYSFSPQTVIRQEGQIAIGSTAVGNSYETYGDSGITAAYNTNSYHKGRG